MAQWTHPQCEACWIRENGVYDTVTDDLLDVRLPVKIKDAPLETCCTCGYPTIMGIYVRKDPKEVPYPAPEEKH